MPTYRHPRLTCLITLLTAMIALAGCGAQRQHLADALAGSDAARIITDTAAQREEIDQPVAASMTSVIDGMADYIRAAAGDRELPPPTLPPHVIAAQSDTYAADGAQAREDAAGSWWWLLAGGAATMLGVAVKTAKRLPGLIGTAAAMADGLLPTLEPLRRRRVQRGRELADEGLARLLQLTPRLWSRLEDRAPQIAADLRDDAIEVLESVSLDAERRQALLEAVREQARGHAEGLA